MGLVHKKQWKQAAKLSQELLRQHPGNAMYSYWLGVARFSLGNVIGAIQAMRWAQLHGLNTLDLHLDLGLAYYTIHQYVLFRQQMEQAIKLDPNSFAPQYYMGRYLASNVNDYGRALQYFERATELDPRDAKSWYYRGDCLKELGRRSKARAAFEKAINLVQASHDSFSLPFQGMAQLLLETDPKRALKFAQEATELQPNIETNHLVMAKAYEKQGVLPQAAAELQKAIKLNPTDPSPRFLIFRVYTRLGNKQAAQAALEGFEKVNREYGAM